MYHFGLLQCSYAVLMQHSSLIFMKSHLASIVYESLRIVDCYQILCVCVEDIHLHLCVCVLKWIFMSTAFFIALQLCTVAIGLHFV